MDSGDGQENKLLGAEMVKIEEQPYVSNVEFLDLNDDCIREVFRSLEIKSLYFICKASPRLRTIARSHFASEYKDKRFRFRANIYRGDMRQYAHWMLNTFGDLICDFSVFNNCLSRFNRVPIFEFLKRYSYTEKLQLKTLTFDHITSEYMGYSELQQAQKFIQNIKGLVFNQCGILEVPDDDSEYLAIVVIKLMCIETLESIEIFERYGSNCAKELMTIIAQFKRLRVLKISKAELHDDHLEVLYNLPELTTLCLKEQYNITASGLVKLIANLPKIQQLSLISFPLTYTEYSQILKICRNLNKSLTIKLDKNTFAKFNKSECICPEIVDVAIDIFKK